MSAMNGYDSGHNLTSRKAKSKKAMDAADTTSRLLEAKISQLEREAASDKDQEAEIEREVKRANRDLSQHIAKMDDVQKIEHLLRRSSELLADMRRLERENQRNKKRGDALQKDKEAKITELGKTTQLKEKLEKLCRELQKDNNKFKNENKTLSDSLARNTKAHDQKMENILNIMENHQKEKDNPSQEVIDVSVEELFQQRFKTLIEQYELRELHFHSQLRTKELELQYSLARFEQQKGQSSQHSHPGHQCYQLDQQQAHLDLQKNHHEQRVEQQTLHLEQHQRQLEYQASQLEQQKLLFAQQKRQYEQQMERQKIVFSQQKAVIEQQKSQLDHLKAQFELRLEQQKAHFEQRLAQQTEAFEEKTQALKTENRSLSVSGQKLRSQVNQYAEKFKQFEETLITSNTVFNSFRQEIGVISKRNRVLERENKDLKRMQHLSNESILQLAEEREEKLNEKKSSSHVLEPKLMDTFLKHASSRLHSGEINGNPVGENHSGLLSEADSDDIYHISDAESDSENVTKTENKSSIQKPLDVSAVVRPTFGPERPPAPIGSSSKALPDSTECG